MVDIIRIENLTKEYGEIIANDNINLKIREGEIVGIVGPNGAGKTTLIKQLTGELIPTSGKIYVMDFDVVKDPSPIKPYIGVCPQEGSLLYYLTVWEHVYYFARLKGLPKDKARENTQRVLEMLGLENYKNRLVGQLSGGLKRKVFVSIALVNNPRIIFLDEPTTGLDPDSRIKLWNTIKEIKEGNPEVTMLITTHYLEELDYLSNRIVFIHKGKVILDGTISDIKRLVLNYTLKVSVPAGVKEHVFGLLNKTGVFGKVEVAGERVSVLLSEEDGVVFIPELLKITKDITITTPTLDEVFMEVVKNEETN